MAPTLESIAKRILADPSLRIHAAPLYGDSIVAMRQVTDHVLNPANEALMITVLDEPGQGGACYAYQVTGFSTQTNPSLGGALLGDQLFVLFQNGPIKEAGVNGITGEALLAIEIDRLRSFQNGEYRCRENAIALTHLEEALLWLQKRTRDRMARGVEGTHAK